MVFDTVSVGWNISPARLREGASAGPEPLLHETVSASPSFETETVPPVQVIEASVSPEPPEPHRHILAEHGLVGSMGRRGNPYDNAKAESFMKNLKVEAPEIFPALSMGSISLARSIPR